MTTLRKTLVAATIAASTATAIYEARQAWSLEDRVRVLEQQLTPLAAQIEQVSQERDTATKKLGVLRQEQDLLRRETADVHKLRGEVARLRNDSQELTQLKAANLKEQSDRALKERNGPALGGGIDPAGSEMELWTSRVKALKQRLEQNPAARIPELQFATEQDWLNAAKNPMQSDADVRQALSELRGAAINKFAAVLQPALNKFVQVNNGQFPNDLSQLQAYLNAPVDNALLQRYEIAPADTVPFVKMGGERIITQKSPVDAEYDSRWVIGPKGFGSAKGAKIWGH